MKSTKSSASSGKRQSSQSSSSSSAFATYNPVPYNKSSSSQAARKSKSPANIRASASPPQERGESGSEDHDHHRLLLERLMHIEMIPSKSKRAECTCIWCNGTKLRKCSWCDGRGYRQEFVQKSWEEISTDIEKMQSSGTHSPMEKMPKVDVQCSACSGTKHLRCRYCRGSGIGSYGFAY